MKLEGKTSSLSTLIANVFLKTSPREKCEVVNDEMKMEYRSANVTAFNRQIELLSRACSRYSNSRQASARSPIVSVD